MMSAADLTTLLTPARLWALTERANHLEPILKLLGCLNPITQTCSRKTWCIMNTPAAKGHCRAAVLKRAARSLALAEKASTLLRLAQTRMPSPARAQRNTPHHISPESKWACRRRRHQIAEVGESEGGSADAEHVRPLLANAGRSLTAPHVSVKSVPSNRVRSMPGSPIGIGLRIRTQAEGSSDGCTAAGASHPTRRNPN